MKERSLRLSAVQLVLLLAFVVVIVRSAQVQLVQGAGFRERAQASRTERIVLPARRGGIFDRQGTPLALTLEQFHLGVAPRELVRRDAATALLAQELGLSEREVARRLRGTRWAYFHGPYSAAQVQALRRVRGVHLELTLSRFYPSNDLTRTVIGRPAKEGRPATGIEAQLDTLLRGSPGEAVVLKDPSGRRYESPSRRVAEPAAGMDVFLTIDAELQEIARQALRSALRTTGAEQGTVVALDPGTGDVLAALTVDQRGVPRPGPFRDAYEPGSIAKIFTAATLYELDRVRDDEWVSGENGRWDLGFRVIHDVQPRSRFTLAEAVKFSSNIGVAKFAERLSAEEQYLALRRFGFGTPTGVEAPLEGTGRLRPPHRWDKASSQSLAMGYEFAATPLQIASAYAALANGGLLMQPHLVLEIRTPSEAVFYRREPVIIRRVVSDEVAERLRGLLEGTVEEGTGSEASLSRFSLGGKTGTARRVVNGAYQLGAYNATFLSLFPAKDPQLVTFVSLRDPKGDYHAGETAAPVARALIEQVLSTGRRVIDRGQFAEGVRPDDREFTVPQGEATFVVEWPVAHDSESAPPAQVVPDVAGLQLREAIRTLHRRGFRVQLTGWGVARGTTPAAGERAAGGTTVTLFAEVR